MPFTLGKLGAQNRRYQSPDLPLKTSNKKVGKKPRPSVPSLDKDKLLKAIVSDDISEIENLVLKKHVSVNIEINQKSLLAIALEADAYVVASFLVAAGANVNYLYPTSVSSLLSHFVRGDDRRAVEFLLRNKAKVNDKRLPISSTPLFLAIENENTEIVKLLIEAGADIHLKVNGKTLVERAAQAWYSQGRNMSEIVKLLNKAGAKPS
jgi:ankyrin repeat protein